MEIAKSGTTDGAMGVPTFLTKRTLIVYSGSRHSVIQSLLGVLYNSGAVRSPCLSLPHFHPDGGLEFCHRKAGVGETRGGRGS